MIFLVLLIVSALSVSAVAGYFSIIGLMAIFPAVKIPIMAMGIVLELAKLVTASWLYRNWKKAGFLLRTYFTASVIILSIITSMGIYGYLSKAHLEHSVITGDKSLQIARIDARLAQQQRRIDDAQQVIGQLDQAVQTLINYDRIRGAEGSLAVRQSQSLERQTLNLSIDDAGEAMETLLSSKLVLETEQLVIEVEVGPIKYIAELIYGDSDKELLDKAVRFVILLLVVVFDPLAILLVISANMSLMERRGESMTFLGDDATEAVEDFMMDAKPEPSVPSPEPVKVVVAESEPVLSDTEIDQLRRLDRNLRNKLGWLIDKKEV